MISILSFDRRLLYRNEWLKFFCSRDFEAAGFQHLDLYFDDCSVPSDGLVTTSSRPPPSPSRLTPLNQSLMRSPPPF